MAVNNQRSNVYPEVAERLSLGPLGRMELEGGLGQLQGKSGVLEPLVPWESLQSLISFWGHFMS